MSYEPGSHLTLSERMVIVLQRQLAANQTYLPACHSRCVFDLHLEYFGIRVRDLERSLSLYEAAWFEGSETRDAVRTRGRDLGATEG
jgi:hypothetical protein